MDNLSHHPQPKRTETPESTNLLWNYVQSMDHDVIDRLSHPSSEEVQQVMERHIISLLGQLPAAGFEVSVTTNREHLGHLLSAAMMNGYFLRAAEQRMAFDSIVQGEVSDINTPPAPRQD